MPSRIPEMNPKMNDTSNNVRVAAFRGSTDAETAVVIPVYNQLHYTRKCLESLKKHAKGIGEIIVVDNGSMPDMAEYLSGIDYIRVISNKENLGCAAAWNQGLDATDSNWVLFLNNDVLLTPGWLEGMLEFAQEKQIDIVSPAIREGACNYDLEAYSKEFVGRMKNHARIGVADGICFLVRRTVFERVGRFDENFRIGQFEDVDFFRRAAMAGFRLGITGRSIIHHFGSVTQNHIRTVEKTTSYAAANRAYYRRKWKLTWYKRFIMRHYSKARDLFWRLKERALGGHTLKGERG